MLTAAVSVTWVWTRDRFFDSTSPVRCTISDSLQECLSSLGSFRFREFFQQVFQLVSGGLLMASPQEVSCQSEFAFGDPIGARLLR